jgi:sec-independent protein translocase protein TatC
LKDVIAYVVAGLAAYGLFFVLTFIFSKKAILQLLNYYDIAAYSFSPLDTLNVQMTFSVYISITLTIPILLYLVYLYTKEFSPFKRISLIILVSAALATIGFIFGITVISKIILESFQTLTFTEYQWGLESIIELVLSTGLLMACILQFILIIPCLMRYSIFPYEQYKKKRFYVLFILLLIIAIITPDTTMVSNLALFVPLVVSVEGGVLIGLMTRNKNVRNE